ncbi:MAG: hypothetical protein ACOZAM_25810 [Pseudomonadota bacterium]
MIILGKSERGGPAADQRESVRRALQRAGGEKAGIDRHAALVDAFIRASELVQGCADAGFDARGFDRHSAHEREGAFLLFLLGRLIGRSWRSGFRSALDVTPVTRQLDGLDLPFWIRIRKVEGYAHYALYPESYLRTAECSGLGRRSCVIGIRSAGLGLAALVAAALGAEPARSLRPVGHPFDRRLRISADFAREEVADRRFQFAIVDEGPGLSGSSFACVARWLMSHGVAARRIHLFPSHGGSPGHSATAATRGVWREVHVHPPRTDPVLDGRVGAWIGDRLGGSKPRLEEISAGAWREASSARSSLPVDTRFERRKFLVRAATGNWFVKFAGLGRSGRRKFQQSRLLASAGFVPEPVTFCHGLMAEKWISHHPTPVVGRGVLVARLCAYLAFRARHLGPSDGGASLERLCEMAQQNTREVLGAERGERLEPLIGGAHRLQHLIAPICVDGRLHAWEWLREGPNLIKTDAVDHCRGHDLVGGQDVLWDVAGALVEYDLTGSELSMLRKALGRQSDRDEALLAILIPCYLAFQLGLWSTAVACPGAEQANDQTTSRYARKLSRYLENARHRPGHHALFR